MTLIEALMFSLNSSLPEGCDDEMLLTVFRWRRNNRVKYRHLCEVAKITHPSTEYKKHVGGGVVKLIDILNDGQPHSLSGMVFDLKARKNSIVVALVRLRKQGVDIEAVRRNGDTYYRLRSDKEKEKVA